MARNKLITDKELLKLIQKFLEEKCGGNASKLKLPAIAEYVSQTGYPGYRVETLRRNKAARDYIDTLMDTAEGKALVTVVTYKSLDIEAFLTANTTHQSMTRALTQLDTYYKTIADSAVLLNGKYKELEKQVEIIANERDNALKQLNELTISHQATTNLNKILKKENEIYKKVLSDYVYPDIANELLKKEGILKKSSSYIESDVLETKIITSSTCIIPDDSERKTVKAKSGSNVIQGLFDDFK